MQYIVLFLIILGFLATIILTPFSNVVFYRVFLLSPVILLNLFFVYRGSLPFLIALLFDILLILLILAILSFDRKTIYLIIIFVFLSLPLFFSLGFVQIAIYLAGSGILGTLLAVVKDVLYDKIFE